MIVLKVIGIVLAVIVFIFAALLIVPMFFRKARIRRRIVAVPIVPISEIQDQSLVRIVGEVKLMEEFRAPFSDRKVAIWELNVRHHGAEGGTGGMVKRRGGGDFLIEDSSGSAQVRVQGAVMAMAEDHQERFSSSEAPPFLYEILESAGNRFSDSYRAEGNAKIIANECVIEEGETVAVVGLATLEGGQVVISAAPKQELLVSDDAI